MLRLAIPSDGALHESTLLFLKSCGLDVTRTGTRVYTGRILALPNLVVNFQRASDIVGKVEEEAADLGIVGQDRFSESRVEDGKAQTIIDGLGFGHAELVIGVPDSWVDVTSIADLSDLSIEFREKGINLRVATKYPRLVENFLIRHGVNYFSLVASSGTLEAAPSMGYADLIADISSTGTTLRQNRLKTIDSGSVLKSEACLIANQTSLAESQDKLELAIMVVSHIEAHLQATGYFSITTNIKGKNAEEIASAILTKPDLSGLLGPTIAKVYTNDEESWYAVTMIVEKDKLSETVNFLQNIGGTSISVSQPNYLFQSCSQAVKRLVAKS